MKKSERRREIEIAGLSFLDVICCGFGAVILLLVLVKFAEPVLLEQTTEELEAIGEKVLAAGRQVASDAGCTLLWIGDA